MAVFAYLVPRETSLPDRLELVLARRTAAIRKVSLEAQPAVSAAAGAAGATPSGPDPHATEEGEVLLLQTSAQLARDMQCQLAEWSVAQQEPEPQPWTLQFTTVVLRCCCCVRYSR